MNVEQIIREDPEALDDAPPTIIADINTSPQMRPYKNELIAGARVRYNLGVLRQRMIKESEDRIERCYMEGIGRKIAAIDLRIFKQLQKSWGHNWFRDRKTLYAVLKANPFLQVRCLPTFANRSFGIRVDGFKEQKGKAEEPGAKVQTPGLVAAPVASQTVILGEAA